MARRKWRRGATSESTRDLGALAAHQAEPEQTHPEQGKGCRFRGCYCCTGLQPLLSPGEQAQLVSARTQQHGGREGRRPNAEALVAADAGGGDGGVESGRREGERSEPCWSACHGKAGVHFRAGTV